MDIVAAAREAGIVRANREQEPFHRTLSRALRVVIVAGLDDDLVGEAERALILHHSRALFQGLDLALRASGADEAMVVYRRGDASLVDRLREEARHYPYVRLIALEDTYPAGEPFVLLDRLLGIRLSPGADPESAGVLVAAPHDLWHLARALEGRPLTHRFVSIVGAVKHPQTVRAPIGAACGDLLTHCGGPSVEGVGMVMGGILRGRPADESSLVSPSTSVLIVLPEGHEVLRRQGQTTADMLRRAALVCSACRQCSERCPPRLLGRAIHPHLLMRGLAYRLDACEEIVTGPSNCLGCGLCQAICPAGLSPGRLYEALGVELKRRGVWDALPPSSRPRPAAPDSEIHMPSRSWLIRRHGLEAWSGSLPLDDNELPVREVTVGRAGAELMVEEGRLVAKGALIALDRRAEVRIHAPISGEIHRKSSFQVRIVRRNRDEAWTG